MGRGAFGRWRARLADEAGISIVEVMAAMTILSVSFVALAGASATGLRLVSGSGQRQAATEIANARLEHLRNIPYPEVALPTALTQATDPEDPDASISADGSRYDVTGSGGWEDLVVGSGGAVAHIEDPVAVGKVQLTTYQYVTWVDDASASGAQDYKRLTVIVKYKRPVQDARARWVRVSTLLTPGTVTVGGTVSGPQAGSTSSPTPSPTLTPPGLCVGDDDQPGGTFSILSGTGAQAGFTASTSATISLAPSDPCAPITVALSNDGTTFGSAITYDALNPTVTWTLPAGDGSKSVWARFTDAVGNVASLGPEAITLDMTKPATPGTLVKANVVCSGTNRTVTVSWGSSMDVNFLGYRIYKSVDNAPFVTLATSASTSISDTDRKTLDSLRYKVVGYDKAGNESIATNEVSLAKNQCS